MSIDELNMGDGTPDVASAMECTGLVPSLTDAAGEASQRRLYAIPRARRSDRPHRKK